MTSEWAEKSAIAIADRSIRISLDVNHQHIAVALLAAYERGKMEGGAVAEKRGRIAGLREAADLNESAWAWWDEDFCKAVAARANALEKEMKG